MSKKDAIVLASRAVALYLIVSAFYEMTYLPAYVREVLYYWNADSPASVHFREIYLLDLVFHIVRLFAFGIAASWFYQSGPRVHEYFLPDEDEGANSSQ